MKIQDRLKKYKPGVSNKTHLLLAASFWTLIGTFLFGKGLFLLYNAELLILAIPAILLGWVKSFFILERAAKKNINRILNLHDGTCMGAVFSKMTWIMVLGMSLFGIFIRHSTLPKYSIGIVLVLVGFSLLYSSKHAWVAWRSHDRK